MSTDTPQEKTFRQFSAADGKSYATQRTAYPQALYKVIFEHHAATGGRFGTVLDVGCGPGISLRHVATAFEGAIGVDASPGMVASARELGGKTSSGKDIRYEVSPAESFSEVEGVEAESVDLLTAATAAHWFDMAKFWVEAEKVLKPGGTVAIWTNSNTTCHPSTPNADQIKAVLRHWFEETLKPYLLPGNLLAQGLYDDLLMPWQTEPPVPGLPKSSFVKHVYDRDGVLSDGKDFFGGGRMVTLSHINKILSTTSPVVRWREAHPDLVDTDQDVVAVLVKELAKYLDGQQTVVAGGGVAILLFKKVVQEK